MPHFQMFMIPGRPPRQEVTVTNDVTVIDASDNSPINEYDEDTAVVSLTETTILTYTVPAGKTAKIQGMVVGGTASGRFRLKVDGTTKTTMRTSTANRGETTNFDGGPIEVSAGGVVTVTAYHSESLNQTMEANLFGYTV